MAVTVLSAAVWAAAPKTEQATAPLALNQAKANSTYSIIGQWWSPSNAANWPAIYVNLASGSQNTTFSPLSQVVFFSHVNGSIKANAGFEIRTVDADISSVSQFDWSGATPVTSLGSGGWYTYNSTTHGNEAIQPLTVLVGDGNGALYAIKLLNFSNVGQRIGSTGLEVKADVNIEVKAL